MTGYIKFQYFSIDKFIMLTAVMLKTKSIQCSSNTMNTLTSTTGPSEQAIKADPELIVPKQQSDQGL